MDFRFVDPWHAFLPREGGHVVAIAGSGGKTSLMRACAEALRADGAPVVVTTTTRTEPLAWPGLVPRAWEDVAEGRARGEPYLAVHAGGPDPAKWHGLSIAQADRLGRLLPDHVALVEADGSARLPLKLHRDDEPVWPGRTSLAVLVMGLGALDRPLAATLHRHGRLPAPWLPAGDGAAWTWELLLRLLAGPGGYRGRVPAGVPVALALTQLAACRDGPGLYAFVGRAMAEARIPLVLLAELAGGEPSVRTACQADADLPAPSPAGGDA